MTTNRADAGPAEQVIQQAITAYCDDLFKLADPHEMTCTLPGVIAEALREADMLAERSAGRQV